MKNILFIGDLRTAYNYGAIATTETLMHLLEKENFDAEYKYIDRRSLYAPTPEGGFPPRKWLSYSKKVSKKFFPLALRKFINKITFRTKTRVDDFVPYKFSQYEKYYQQMQEGSILQYERKLLEWADIVYINGEGNIVNGTDEFGIYRTGARYILFMAWCAKMKYGKPTLIVNHTVDPNNYNAFEMISNIYPHLDEIIVRETLSIPVLESHGVHNASFVPDALFAYHPVADWKPSKELCSQIDFTKPYICIGDSSGIKNRYNKVKWDVVKVLGEIIDELQKIIPQVIFVDGYNNGNEQINKLVKQKNIGRVNLDNCSYHDLYHVLQRASIFISGRWHASILCTLANTPILLWGADSHKTKALYTLLDYKYRFFEVSTLPANIPELIDEVSRVLKESETVKTEMRHKIGLYSKTACQDAAILRKYVEA